jgi:hypothetical protein
MRCTRRVCSYAAGETRYSGTRETRGGRDAQLERDVACVFNLVLNEPLEHRMVAVSVSALHVSQERAAAGSSWASFSAGVRPWSASENRSTL